MIVDRDADTLACALPSAAVASGHVVSLRTAWLAASCSHATDSVLILSPAGGNSLHGIAVVSLCCLQHVASIRS